MIQRAPFPPMLRLSLPHVLAIRHSRRAEYQTFRTVYPRLCLEEREKAGDIISCSKSPYAQNHSRQRLRAAAASSSLWRLAKEDLQIELTYKNCVDKDEGGAEFKDKVRTGRTSP